MITVIKTSTLENDNESTNRIAIIPYRLSKAIIRFLLSFRSAIIPPIGDRKIGGR